MQKVGENFKDYFMLYVSKAIIVFRCFGCTTIMLTLQNSTSVFKQLKLITIAVLYNKIQVTIISVLKPKKKLYTRVSLAIYTLITFCNFTL